ncbi:MAG TPA: TonB-dependent receptor, partial [Chitinophagaceae bacterium]|nr:TonB-dependent receptor [Chitinophagaceae bacterium]
MINRRKSLLLLTATLLSIFVYAQSATIKGTVKDNKGKPVHGANIALKDTYDGAVSDSLGRFSFKTMEKGEQTLVISFTGYKTVEQKLTPAAGLPELNISIKEEITEMKAVVVTAGTFEASDKKRAGVVLNSIDIVTTASANADVTQALKTLPGAQQVGEAEGLFVRGGTAAETKVFIDGTLVNKFFYSTSPNVAGYGRFSPFLFKGTVFSTGGYSALYGQALSAAVILESIDLPDQTTASLGITVLSLDAGYQKLNKKKTASWGFDYNYTNLGLAFAVLKQKQDYFTMPGFHDGHINFRIKTSATGMLKYYGNISASRLGFREGSIDAPGYNDLFTLKNFYHYHNLAWKENLGNGWKINLGVSYTNNDDKITGGLQDQNNMDVSLPGLEFKKFRAEPNGEYANAKMVIEKRLRNLSAIRFGSEYNYSNDRTTYVDNNGTSYSGREHEHTNSLFAEGDVYITNGLAAKLGARLERASGIDRFNLAPRISLAYKTGKESQVSLAYGVFYQNPEARYLPSPNHLDFSKATHYIAQYLKTTNLTVFRAEIYYKEYKQLLKTGFDNGREGIALNNQGFGHAKGLEFFWRDKKTFKDLDYWISYTFLDTKRDYLNFPSEIMPNFAAKHNASLVIKKFVLPWKTGFNLSYTWSSSRPYYNIKYDGSNYQFTDKGEVPDYHNVSFSLNYIPSIGKKNSRSFIVYVLSVNNILNIRQTYG